MAPRGSNKARSVDHEDYIAWRFGGTRNEGSGAHDSEHGDVITPGYVFECKTTGEPKLCKHERDWFQCPDCYRKPTMIQRMEKVFDEAHEVGRVPVLALRYYDPDSILANKSGFVDFIVRHIDDEPGLH